MTFACIEYTTKTRRIWRPTPEKPNYLCDPDKEIDPTSFGCYTTALDGEHIPLTGLIYDSATHPPSKIRRLRQDLFRRRHGAFGPYSLAYLKKFDVLLVIYQISNSHELVRFVERTREEFPDTILVSCSSPPFGRLREHWKDHPETAERYRAFLAATHVNMNVCRATVPFYRAFTPTPSLYLPQPYPVEYALSVAQAAHDPAMPDAPSGLSARAAMVSRQGGTSERAFPEPASVGPARKARGAGEPGSDPLPWQNPPRPPDIIVQMDGDLSHNPSDVPRLLKELEYSDLAIGSRYVRGGGTANWALGRRLLSRGANVFARTMTGASVHDLTGGFNAWRASLLSAVRPNTINADGYGYLIELKVRAARSGARIVEVPILFTERRSGVSKLSKRVMWEAVGVVLRLSSER